MIESRILEIKINGCQECDYCTKGNYTKPTEEHGKNPYMQRGDHYHTYKYAFCDLSKKFIIKITRGYVSETIKIPAFCELTKCNTDD